VSVGRVALQRPGVRSPPAADSAHEQRQLEKRMRARLFD
jgi:hypothetical protein